MNKTYCCICYNVVADDILKNDDLFNCKRCIEGIVCASCLPQFLKTLRENLQIKCPVCTMKSPLLPWHKKHVRELPPQKIVLEPWDTILLGFTIGIISTLFLIYYNIFFEACLHIKYV